MKYIRVPEYHFNELKKIIENHGGKLISEKYGNTFYKKTEKIKKHNFE